MEMPGYTREMLALVNVRIDMNNKYQMLMKEVHNCLLLFRPDVYIVAHPDPPETPAVIKVQIIWNSKTHNQHMSFNRALRSEENYQKALAQIKVVLTFAFQDSFTLGTSPFEDLMFGLI